MTKIRHYFPKILLTFLLIFLLIGTGLSFLVQHSFLTYKAFETVTNQQNLDEKAYSALESYFKSRANSTGIPAEVYLNAVTQKIPAGHSFQYFSSFKRSGLSERKSRCLFCTMDFTALENSVTEFFNQYADENSFQKDDVFNQKVQANIQEAEAKILYTADTFKFSTLSENGWLAKLRKFLSPFRNVMTALFIVTGIIILLLAVFCKSQFSELLYWLGLSSFLSGLLTAVPCLYVLGTDYFSGFVIKDPQIFSAVVGYLQYVTSQLRTTSLCMCGAGVLFLIIFRFCS